MRPLSLTLPLALVAALAACSAEEGTLVEGATTTQEPPAAAAQPGGRVGATTDPTNASVGQGTAPTAPGVQGASGPNAGNVLQVSAQGGPAPYLTDRAGNALYYLEGDKDGSQCTGPCLEAWPPLLASPDAPQAGAGVRATHLGTVPRDNGALQVSYNGHPLHRYAADTGAGRTAGHGVEDQWGRWVLVSPEGEAVPAATPSGGSAP